MTVEYLYQYISINGRPRFQKLARTLKYEYMTFQRGISENGRTRTLGSQVTAIFEACRRLRVLFIRLGSPNSLPSQALRVLLRQGCSLEHCGLRAYEPATKNYRKQLRDIQGFEQLTVLTVTQWESMPNDAPPLLFPHLHTLIVSDMEERANIRHWIARWYIPRLSRLKIRVPRGVDLTYVLTAPGANLLNLDLGGILRAPFAFAPRTARSHLLPSYLVRPKIVRPSVECKYDSSFLSKGNLASLHTASQSHIR
jgi:hypothetical protein